MKMIIETKDEYETALDLIWKYMNTDDLDSKDEMLLRWLSKATDLWEALHVPIVWKYWTKETRKENK